jgi:hypothetical protein
VHLLWPPRPLRWVAVGAVLGVLLAACSSGSGGAPTAGGQAGASASTATSGGRPFTPQLISSETIVGPNRFLFGLLDSTGLKPLTDPSATVQVTFQWTAATPSGQGATATPMTIQPIPATFIWAIPDERGVYAAEVAFPAAGDWRMLVNVSGGSGAIPSGTVAVQFEVSDTGHAIPIGGKAPSTKTPTAATRADVAKIATDPDPEPSFYTTSVDEALARHEPFVLAFATPAFCTSKQCGPTLDGIKAVAKTETGITFINAEPYKLEYVDGRLQPDLGPDNQLQATDAVKAWGIVSEPWVFVVDGDGTVRGSFEAVVSPGELKAAIAAAH